MTKLTMPKKSLSLMTACPTPWMAHSTLRGCTPWQDPVESARVPGFQLLVRGGDEKHPRGDAAGGR